MAFPPGFEMIVRQSYGPKTRVSFECIGKSECKRGTENCKPIHTCDGYEGSCLPTSQCSDLKIKIVFPACWDGKRLTSASFMDHVAYGKGQWSVQKDAYLSECPDTHKVRIPEIHFYFHIRDYKVNTCPHQKPDHGMFSQFIVIDAFDKLVCRVVLTPFPTDRV